MEEGPSCTEDSHEEGTNEEDTREEGSCALHRDPRKMHRSRSEGPSCEVDVPCEEGPSCEVDAPWEDKASAQASAQVWVWAPASACTLDRNK